MPGLSRGQRDAIAQLLRIATASAGTLRLDQTHNLADDAEIRVDLVLDCADVPVARPGGVKLADREVVSVYLPAWFPYVPPRATVSNPKFANLPHVIWGEHLCLYLAVNDWQPDRGMWGFVDRLLTWLMRAASGTLTGPAVPWHPPVPDARQVYPGRLVFRADLPPPWEEDGRLWTAWVAVQQVRPGFYEVRRWVRGPEEARQLTGAGGAPTLVAPVVALPEPLGFTFPLTIGDLYGAVDTQGLSRPDLERLMWTAIRAYPRKDADDLALGPVVLIGSPAPDRTTTPGRVAHLLAWHVLSAKAVAALTDGTARLDAVPMQWLPIDDQRPRTTARRDTSRPARWLAGRRVLLLGCGALGAPIAEHCVRAGVAQLWLVDDHRVSAGILVRQPYEHRDIGRPKVTALAERLRRIDPDVTVQEYAGDALAFVGRGWEPANPDLVVDATANRRVAVAVERFRRLSGQRPPILSVFVGHESDRGVATLALAHSRGAGVDILRRLAVSAADDDALADVLDDFFPDPPRASVFQPEPGCSDPTFVGSSADLAALAAQLLNAGTILLGEADRQAAAPARSATVVRLPTLQRPQGTTQRLRWPDDLLHHDQTHQYEVRVEPAAFAAVRRHLTDAAARAADPYETGGALLGSVDPASRVVWVTEAHGLPPGGSASPAHVAFDFATVADVIDRRRAATRGMVSLIGAWHSHPHGHVGPSDRDHHTMAKLVDGKPVPGLAHALLMIVSPAEDWATTRRLDVHVQMFLS